MYVFVDLETTGLDPEDDGAQILEVGILVLDDLFKEVDTFRQETHFIAYVDGKLRPRIHPKVDELHTKSRLWEACANSYRTPYMVESNALKFMEPYKGEPMCGSTISFDRAWLHELMPDLEAMFHYRNLDVSSFKVAFEKLGLVTPAKKEAHRALADARESADNLRFYYKALGIGPLSENPSS